ncbi:MAG: endonuclease/exonuclease/phosphatase family protein [Pseudomonadota bacterium]
MLRDIARGEDEQIAAIVDAVAAVDPDVLLLLGFDYDAGLAALTAFAESLAAAGIDYPHRFAQRPNAGWPTGVDVDGDGQLAEPQDAHGYGRFSGQGGMALLSRYQVSDTEARNFSDLLWRDLPGNRAADVIGPEVQDVLRLSTMAIWDIPVVIGDTHRLNVLAIHAGAPVFDGPEDRNGIRNEDETAFLLRYLDGWSPDGAGFAAQNFAVLGTLNVDPERGEGRTGALRALLADPRLQDPEPQDPDGQTATTNWQEPSPGRLRVDYILPSSNLAVLGAGIHGTAEDEAANLASGHRLVWMDIQLPN